jgi:arabinogalactan oligomer/maltooligosaccharide transport system substrate-binding protein
MRRGMTAALVAAALAVSAAACGDGDPSTEPVKDPAAISGTVTWWDTSDATNEAPAFRELVRDFQAKYPKIKINYVNVPFADAQNKFKTAAQSGSGAPDVIRAEVGWTTEFAALGYLAPLEGTRALEEPADLLPIPAASGRFAGRTYAVPQVTDTLALLYNKSLLKKAGHDAPPATLDDLKKAALDVRKKTGAEGVGLNVDSYYLLPFIYGEGGDLVDASHKKVTVDSAQAVTGVRRVADLISSGAAPEPTVQDSYQNLQTAFKDGRLAMMYNGPWSMVDDYKGKAFKDRANLGVAPVPAGSVRAGSPTGGHDYAVYAGSKNLAASYEFVRFMAGTRSQVQITRALGLLPTRTSAYAQVADAPQVRLFKPAVDKEVPRQWIPEGGLLFDPLLQGYQKLVSGQATPETMLKGVGDKYRGLLKGWS